MSYVTNEIRMDYFSCVGKRTRAKTDLYIESLYRLSKLKKNEDSKGHNNERKPSKNVVKAERDDNASSVSARNKEDGKKTMIGDGVESSESRVSDDVEYLGVGLKFKGNDGIIRDDDVGSCVSAAGFGSSGVNLRCCKSKDAFGGGDDVIEVIQKEDGIEVIQQEDVIEVIQIEDGIEVIQQEDVIEVIQKEDGIKVIQQEDIIGVIQKEDVIEVIQIEDGIEVIQQEDVIEVIQIGDDIEVIQIEEESD